MHVHIAKMPLKKLFNTRDLGGIPTEDGRSIRYGKLIRSGKLYKLPQKTVNTLKEYGVTTVIDLRIFTECEEYPDTKIEGVTYYHMPVLCTATAGITREKSMRRTMKLESKRIKKEFGTVDNYMTEMYCSILFNQEPQEQLKSVLRLIIDNENCLIWHCSSGKDRAGIVAMLTESLLGVSEDIIVADYVSSHHFQRRKYFWNRLALIIAPFSIRFKKILFGMMSAKSRFLTEAMDRVKTTYGSVVNYCKQVLGVTDSDIALMKAKYLE